MTELSSLDAMIAKYATISFDDDTTLMATGLDSLSLVRMAVEVASDDDAELDAAGLIGLRTVGELKRWLQQIAAREVTA